ncbi:MAG: DMT family transporter [Chloroflexi bacterium]|nr:DMT family transporter [Chloroflexota bacterium]
MAARTTRIEWLIFGALGLFWGSSYLFIKIGVETLTPFTLVAGRLLVGSLLLGVVLRASGERLPRDPRIYRHLVVMAILNIVIPFSLITSGEQTIDSSLASILNASVPLFTIIFAALVLTDEPISVNRLVGLVVGFGGVILLTSPSLGRGGGADLPGEIAMIGSSISYAAGNVYARHNVRGLRPMVQAFFQVFFAFVISAALALAVERPFGIAYQASSVFAVLWLGLFGSGLAYLAFFRLLATWGSTRTSLVAYLLPIVGIVLGFVVLHETVDARVLAGTALVVGGVAVANSPFGQRRLFGRRATVDVPVTDTADG